MTTSRGPGPRQVLAILAATITVAAIRLALGAAGTVTDQIGLALDALSAAAMALVAVSILRSPRDLRSRRAWWFLAAFPIAWLIAPIAWSLGLPEIADAGRALAVAFVGTSWWFAARAGGVLSRLRLVGDGAIGAAAVLAIGWSGPLGLAWQEAGSPIDRIAAVALPVAMVGVVVLGAGLTLTEMQPGHRSRPALFLLAMLILAGSDVAWAVDTSPVWAAGWIAYALTMRTQLTTTPRLAPAPTRARYVFLPYALIVPAGLVLLLRSRGTGLDLPEVAAGFAIVALLIVRQHLTLLENDALVRRLRKTEELLRHQATHDALTGLPGRAELLRRLDAVVQRPESGVHVALAFVDVDYLKSVNDRYGHATGDAVLVEVASRLRACLADHGAGAAAARFGGDEFAVLVMAERAVDTAALARSVAAAVGGTIVVGAATLPVTVSVGAAAARSDGLDPSDLLREADLAMYAVKHSRTAPSA